MIEEHSMTNLVAHYRDHAIKVDKSEGMTDLMAALTITIQADGSWSLTESHFGSDGAHDPTSQASKERRDALMCAMTALAIEWCNQERK